MALSAGDRIGLYIIQGVLGHGGMASVYRAIHNRLKREVALKVIHAGIDDAFRQRFVREAQIVGALDHPNIVPVFDFDDSGDTPFLVMKLIGGPTLKTVLAQGQLSPGRIVEICRQIAAALDYAHDLKVLHRDVKPSNILLDEQGTPYLSDFGLARVLHAPDSTISEGMLLGTPFYIAPEQVLGHDIDRRADNYSLGVVVYEMLTGKVPFSAGTPYTILQDQVHADLPRPRLVNPEIPGSVEALLLRALAKDPARRYYRAGEMADALEGAYHNENIPTESTSSRSGRRSATFPIGGESKPVHSLSRRSTHTMPVANSSARTQPSPRRRLHLRYAVALGVAVCLIAALILTFTMIRPQSGASPQDSAKIPMMDVRVIGLAEAQQNHREMPENPTVYLELARAQFADGLARRAEATLQEGAIYADRPLPYWLTAAEIALDAGQYLLAIRIYAQILNDAIATSQYPAVRNQVGQILYRLVGEADRLSPMQTLAVSQDLREQNSALLEALLARALIVTENYRLAELALMRSLSQESALPETHLILGELRYQQGETEQAKAEWHLARSAVDAPEWVHQTAQQHLNTLPQ